MDPVDGRKLDKGERTRQRLLSFAVDEILQNGPDRLGFTSIARRAQLTTGALYARYENSDELLVDVWQSVCAPRLARLVHLLTEGMANEPREEVTAELAEFLNADARDLVAAVSLLVVARRSESLRDDIEPSLREMVDKGIVEMPMVPHLLASIMGILLYQRGMEVEVTDWSPLAGALCEMADAVSVRGPTPPVDHREPIKVGPLQLWESADIDEIDSRLFAAVTHVICRVGVDKATVSRIARRANVNPATIYMRYDDKESLISHCIKTVVGLGSERNRSVVLGDGSLSVAEVAARFTAANGLPQYQQEGIFRLETLHAAGHHEHLRRLNGPVKQRFGRMYQEMTGIPEVWKMPTVWPFVVFNRAMPFGHTLMRAYGYLPADDPYFVIMSETIVANMVRGRKLVLPVISRDFGTPSQN